MKRIASAIIALALCAGAAQAQTLRIGMQNDPDALDPGTSQSFWSRIVFASLCDKLIDVDASLNYAPQLATEWAWADNNRSLIMKLRPGVVFHDGEPLNAEAVRVNLERYRSGQESRRRGEMRPVSGVEVVDPLTVRIRLTEPNVTVLSVLSDRAGMIMSPRALAAMGDRISQNPVCAGPFKFVQRVAQERIVLERFDRYWNAGAIHLERVIFQPIANSTARLANLRAGSLELIERLPPTDLGIVRAQPRLRLVDAPAIGYYTMGINVAHGPRARGPLGSDPRVREALEAAIDRNVINQVVMDGAFIPSNQPEAPGTTYYNTERPVPPRDLARARRLLQEAGHQRVSFTLTVVNAPVEAQVGEVIQSMAAEAGFDIRVQPTEAGALVAASERGDFDAVINLWSGRVDPDGNVSIWIECEGFVNRGKYCNPQVDALLAEARRRTDVAERQALYRQASNIYLAERPYLFLYHFRSFWAMTDRISGFRPYPDGLIRLQGVRLAN
jgi:peptide/nickel transport system substrate-binding protein